MNIQDKCDKINSLLGDLSSTGIKPIPDLVFQIRLLLSKIREVEESPNSFDNLISVVRQFMRK